MSDTNSNENWLFSVLNFLRPSKTIPSTSWRADTTWGLINGNQSLQRFLILIFGLFLFGIGEALLVITSLGNSPWVVLSEGISLNSKLNIGQSTFFVSLMVLFFWIPLKQKPGFGTLANIVVISASIELGLLIIPEVNNLVLNVSYVLLGILLVGIGSALNYGSPLDYKMGNGVKRSWENSSTSENVVPMVAPTIKAAAHDAALPSVGGSGATVNYNIFSDLEKNEGGPIPLPEDELLIFDKNKFTK